MSVAAIEELLERERSRFGASSCTFYVRDPFWENELRLLCMPGVLLREPMHGWIFDDNAKLLLLAGDAEVFSEKAEQPPLSEDEQQIISTCPFGFLFQDFSGRENVRSFARLFHLGSNGQIEAVLFINFAQKTIFHEKLRVDIRNSLRSVVFLLPNALDELRAIDAEHLAESVKILQPALRLAKNLPAAEVEGSELESQFKTILRLSLKALRVPESEGVGTIHLYRSDKGILQLAASLGSAPRIDRARTLSISSGRSIVGWVALKRTALLVDDILTSPFREIQVIVNDSVRSELAVPMIADGELVGVLNLECIRAHSFQPGSVRSLWYAANNAAVAFQLTRMAGRTRRFLDICEAAARDEVGIRQAIVDIADVLCETIGADSSDLWHFNSFLGHFDAAGATYKPFIPALRKDGWTNYVWRSRKPVWITDIAAEESFHAHHWNGSWNQNFPAETPPPQRLNKRVVEHNIRAELGLPIMVSNDCVGVAWIKYLRPAPPPSVERMKDAFSVMSQAGLVLELVQRQVERPDRNQLQRVGERLRPYSASQPLDFEPLPLEGYVLHRPFHAFACGDFHAVSKIDSTVRGFLIGDGEGKAVTGLLNALPLVTGFEIFGRDSGSTRHVMDRLRAVSRKLGLSGTALCCTFTTIGSSIWLAITCAGHPLPVIVRGGPSVEVRVIPEHEHPAVGRPLGIDLDSPQGEYQVEFRPGDLLLSYTDGITDALSTAESSGLTDGPIQSIMSTALRGRNLSCQHLAEAIMTAAESANPLLDDATVCVIRHQKTSI